MSATDTNPPNNPVGASAVAGGQGGDTLSSKTRAALAGTAAGKAVANGPTPAPDLDQTQALLVNEGRPAQARVERDMFGPVDRLGGGQDTVLLAEFPAQSAAVQVTEVPDPPDPLEDGTVIADLDGRSVRARGREDRTFGSEASAIAYARGMDSPTAVLQEGNRYAVYEVQADGNWVGYRGKLNLEWVDQSNTADRTDTQITSTIGNLVAVVTSDDYPVQFEPGVGEEGVIARTGGSLVSPVDGILQAHGVGLVGLKEKDEVLDAFELAMRDTAYAALDSAEAEALGILGELEAGGLSAENQEGLDTALGNLAEIDRQIEVLEEERSTAIQDALGERGLFTTAFLGPDLEAISAAAAPFNDQIAALQGQRPVAAADFPLALRIDDPADFRALPRTEQTERLTEMVEGVLEDNAKTRENLDDDDLDLWNERGIVMATAEQLGLDGDHLDTVIEKADWEDTKDMLWNIGEGVVGVGLVVGGLFTGGTSSVAGIALLTGSAAVGLHGALRVTDDYLDLGAAENSALDPNGGIVPEGSAPHWGWVAAAWVGVGLDAAAVVKPAITALRGVNGLEEALAGGRPIAAEVADQAEDTLRALARADGLPANQIDDLVTAMRSTLTANPPRFFQMTDANFVRNFGDTAAEAVTTITRVGDDFQVDIVTRAGADPTAAAIAIREELGHLAQVGNPAWADDVSQLTEEALANWGTRSAAQRAPAYAAQHRLEIDILQSRQQELTELAANGTAAQRAAALDALPAVDENLEVLTRNLDALEGQVPPAWLRDAGPPRLFHTPDVSVVQAAHRQTLGIDEVPEGLLLRRNGDEITAYRDPNSDVLADNMTGLVTHGANGSTVEVVEATTDQLQLTAQARRDVVEGAFGTRLADFDTLEAAVDGLSAFQSAYTRSYAGALETLEAAGVPPANVLARLGDAADMTDPAFERAFRGALREEIVASVSRLDPEDQVAALTRYYESVPNGFEGSLFSAFRAASADDSLRVIDAGTGATTLAGTQRRGDGLVEVIEEARDGGPTLGRYLAEDKASGAAFDGAQFNRYNEALLRDGVVLTEAGEELAGVTYFFPNEAAANRALTHISNLTEGAGPVSSNIYVGFFDEAGTIQWAR